MSEGEPSFLSIGEPIVGLLPTDAEPIKDASQFVACVGGAELNVLVALSRLGFATQFFGCVGDDPFGERVIQFLKAEAVDARHVQRLTGAPTAVYFREWLHDGERRAHYYRHASAGRRLTAADWRKQEWVPLPFAVHVTGITAALGGTPLHAVDAAMSWARRNEVCVSYDPNFRPQLWDPEQAGPVLRRLAERSDVLLMSEFDAAVMFGSADPEHALAFGHKLGATTVVLKLGERGAIGSSHGDVRHVAASPVIAAVDPVGAGDGFDAGFLAGLARGATLSECMALGAFVAARVVEVPGENAGLPTLAELPPSLRKVLGAAHRKPSS